MFDDDISEVEFTRLVEIKQQLETARIEARRSRNKLQSALGSGDELTEAMDDATDHAKETLRAINAELERRDLDAGAALYTLKNAEEGDALTVTLSDGTSVTGLVSSRFDMRENGRNRYDFSINIDSHTDRLCIKLHGQFAEAAFAPRHMNPKYGIDSVEAAETPPQCEYKVDLDGPALISKTVVARTSADAASKAKEEANEGSSHNWSVRETTLRTPTEHAVD